MTPEEQQRVDDYIREATLAYDNAIVTFQRTAWIKLYPCLIEIFDNCDENNLNTEQRFFRLRLQEIHATLQQLGIAPSNGL